MTDEKIIDFFWERREEAIRETEKKYGAYCLQVAQGILHDEEDASECLNDAWLKAWNSIPPARPEHLKCYLVRIVRNLAVSKYRTKFAKKRGQGEVALVLEELEECVAGQADVESLIDASQLQKTINVFVRALPAKDANLFVARYFYAESIREIAKHHFLAENNVRVRLSRMRAKLKKELEKEGYVI